MESTPLDPTKYHVITKKQKPILILSGIILTFIILPILFYIYYSFAVVRPSQTDKEITFEINKGESVSSVSERLNRDNLINSKTLFNLYVLANGKQGSIQAGVYRIPAGTSVRGLVDLFGHGTNDAGITILEGWRDEEVARALSQRFEKLKYESFLNQIGEFSGMLFPDTYNFNKDVDDATVIKALYSNFQRKTSNILTEDTLSKAGISEKQAIILASIVERESQNKDEKKIIAGILMKRWKSGQLVGADATTQYAVALYKTCAPDISIACFEKSGSKCNLRNDILKCISTNAGSNEEKLQSTDFWPNNLNIEDINFDNPYNTRKVLGLPPSPISNPGLDSIEAVVNATPTEYNYYLHDMSGKIYYAKTLEEHNQNISKHLN